MNTSSKDAVAWRETDLALRTPLIPGEKRVELIKRRGVLEATLHEKFFEPEAHEDERKKEHDKSESHHAEHESANSYAEIAHRWNAHPLFEILHTATPHTEEVLEWSDRSGADARRSLEQYHPEKPESKEQAEGEEVDQVFRDRRRLSQAEAESRARAPLNYEIPENGGEDADPIASLRRFDLEQLLIWNGRRVFADSWQDTVKSDFPSPFFARAANDYLEAAKHLNNPPCSAVAEQIDRYQQQFQGKAERLLIKANARPADESEQAAVVALEVGIDARSVQSSKGFAAVYLRDDSHRLVDLPLQRESPGHESYFDCSANDGKAQRFEVNIADTSKLGEPLTAVAFYRGRESAMDFNLSRANGIRIDYVPHRYKDQTVTLIGDRLQRFSIAFILDCSQSMEDPTPITSEKSGQGKTAQRLSLAQEQLKTMLDELVERNKDNEDIHVGVRFFGNRVGWEFDENNHPTGKMKVQSHYQKDEASLMRLGPSHDIDNALPLGKFDYTEYDYIKQKIEELKPWGETPLYQALQETLADFAKEEPDSHKCIIAITDGKNEQTTNEATTVSVMDAWTRSKVPIYILGFHIPDAEAKEAGVAYKKLAEDTGGEFYPVNSGNELLSRLQKQLPDDRYSIPETGLASVKLNNSIPVQDSLLSKDITVAYHSIKKHVRLDGGEAIELYLSENGQDIIAKPYNRLVVVPQTKLLGDLGHGAMIFRAHQPLREKGKNSVRFPISIQIEPKTYHFTRRPLETWVEITPISDAASPFDPYVFYDVNYEPKTPVPVLEWTATNWPADANQARIRFWCKAEPTAAAQVVALHDLLAAKQSIAGVDISAKSVSNGDAYSVLIEERHGPQSPGIEDLRIQCDAGANKPLRVVHHFDALRHIATHSYYFPPELRDNIERSSSTSIVITKARDIKDGALQLPSDGLTVPIQARGELFPESATANGH